MDEQDQGPTERSPHEPSSQQPDPYPFQQPQHPPYAAQAPQTPQHSDNPTRYGAPLPPPPAPSSPAAQAWPSSAWPYVPATGTSRPSRRRGRLAAVATALAVVAVAGGAGFAIGRFNHGQTTAGAPTGGAGQGQLGQGFEGPFSGSGPFSGTPYGQGGQGSSPFDSAAGETPAKSSQLTGLVRISSTLKYENGEAAGTGMILTSTGEVITNHHVVQGSTHLRVTVMSTGRSYTATVVGTDAHDDVAVIQLQGASGLQTVTTDTGAVSVGAAVTAVGDAGGNASRFSAATGKIVATNQHIQTDSQDGRPGEKLSGMIKISSDVIPGDSGGPTYDSQGEVVGMTTAASTGNNNVTGYAVPIAKVVRIAGDLENGTQNARYDYGSPAFLGVGLGGSSTKVGLVYPGTPAAKAGMRSGSTITRVGSTQVSTSAQLRRAIQAFSPGDRVRLSWTDAQGTTHVAAVTLVAGPIA